MTDPDHLPALPAVPDLLATGGPDLYNLQAGGVAPPNEALAEPDRDEQLAAATLTRASKTVSIDALPIIAWTSAADGRLEDLNAAWSAYTGVSREQSLAGGHWAQAFHPDDRLLSVTVWQQAQALGEGFEIDYRLRRTDGAYRWHRGRVTSLRDPEGRLIGWLGTAIDIEDQKRGEQEQDRLLAEAEAIFEAAGDGLFVFDLEGKLRHMNAAARRQFAFDGPLDFHTPPRYVPGGTEVADAEGRPLDEPRWPLFRVLQGEVMTGADAVDLRVRRRDGRIMDLSVTGAPMRGSRGQIIGAVCIARDVTERRRLEQHTRDALDALLEMAQALVLTPVDNAEAVIRQEGEARTIGRRLAALAQRVLACRRLRIVAVEPGGNVQHPLAAVGLTPEQEHYWWTSSEGTSLFGTGSDPAIIALVERMRAGEVFVLDMTPRAWGDRPNPFGVRALLIAPMRVAGELVGILSLDYGEEDHVFTTDELALADATAQLATLVIERDRLLEEREAARASADALREANRRMDQFLAVASHELRTPLTGLRASLQVLQRRLQHGVQIEGAPADPMSRMERFSPLLDRALRQSSELNGLVEDLLDLSRIEAGQLQIHRTSCDLVALVQRVVADQRELAPTRVIRMQLPARETVYVAADAGRLSQVLTNYLTNALKYSAVDQEVLVGLAPEQGLARVWVRDSGPGISFADQERIWERFQRVERTEHRSGSSMGLGLGLYISRTIVERHHGQAGVESAPGAGATFWFALPLIDAPEQSAQAGA
ncbi:MAG TPA: PAS domain S-box protein [Chloroflexota bacterium]|nr:PAS domain S-box protein [Chloroflexota bacterium]